MGLCLGVIATEANRGEVDPTPPFRGEGRGGRLSLAVTRKGDPHEAELQGPNFVVACHGGRGPAAAVHHRNLDLVLSGRLTEADVELGTGGNGLSAAGIRQL